MTRRPIDDPAAAERARLYEEGYSMRQIAAVVGCSHQAVRQWLINNGYHYPRPRSVASAADRARAVEWYKRGYEVAAICARFGIVESTLYRDLRRAGVPLRQPKREQEARRD